MELQYFFQEQGMIFYDTPIENGDVNCA